MYSSIPVERPAQGRLREAREELEQALNELEDLRRLREGTAEEDLEIAEQEEQVSRFKAKVKSLSNRKGAREDEEEEDDDGDDDEEDDDGDDDAEHSAHDSFIDDEQVEMGEGMEQSSAEGESDGVEAEELEREEIESMAVRHFLDKHKTVRSRHERHARRIKRVLTNPLTLSKTVVEDVLGKDVAEEMMHPQSSETRVVGSSLHPAGSSKRRQLLIDSDDDDDDDNAGDVDKVDDEEEDEVDDDEEDDDDGDGGGGGGDELSLVDVSVGEEPAQETLRHAEFSGGEEEEDEEDDEDAEDAEEEEESVPVKDSRRVRPAQKTPSKRVSSVRKKVVRRPWEEWDSDKLVATGMEVSEEAAELLKQYTKHTLYYMQSEVENTMSKPGFVLADLRNLLESGRSKTPYETYSLREHLMVMDWAVQAKENTIAKWIDQCVYKRKGLNTGRRCPHCKSSNLDYKHVQTRSSDEGMTVSIRCNDCNKMVCKF